jgi:beta-phosphoglucomutase-like phosphatase (HAD superfamily)
VRVLKVGEEIVEAELAVRNQFHKAVRGLAVWRHARERLAELRKQQVAVAVSPKAPTAPAPALATPLPGVDPAERFVVQISSQKI